MTNYFTSHTFLSTQLTGLASSNPHSLLYTMRHQNNLSDEQGGTWLAPRSGAPTAQWWDSWNMQRVATPVTHLRISAPLRYPSPINPLPHPHPKNPSCTHTRSSTGHWHQRGHGLRCKTPPACFNFHLPLHDPLQLVTQVASCCTPLLFSPLPSAPFFPSPRFALISAMLHFSQVYVVLTLQLKKHTFCKHIHKTNNNWAANAWNNNF